MTLDIPLADDPHVTQPKSTAGLLPDAQTVTAVRHWTDGLFSFRVTRPASLRFRSGEFVMIGLLGDNGKPILRAYSIASPNWDEELEFYSIKVPDGPLTSRLQHIKPGDQIILRPKPVGTLVLDALLPGKRLWFLATGTGIGGQLPGLSLGDALIMLASLGPTVSAALLGGRVPGTRWPILVIDGLLATVALVVVADVLVLSPALAPGALADLVTVRTDTVRTVGARPGQLLHAAGAPDVDTVVVAGRVVVEHGEHRLGPVAGLLAR